MGTSMQNLHQLLQMPFGCGEQNMVLFAPNIYVLDYLNKTGQLSEEIKSKAIGYLVSGELGHNFCFCFGFFPDQLWLSSVKCWPDVQRELLSCSDHLFCMPVKPLPCLFLYYYLFLKALGYPVIVPTFLCSLTVSQSSAQLRCDPL